MIYEAAKPIPNQINRLIQLLDKGNMKKNIISFAYLPHYAYSVNR